MATETVLVEHQFATLEQQHRAATLGMWVFLATEIMVFGVLICGFVSYRAIYSDAFEAMSSHLNVGIGAINTVVLLTSSLTMALAVYSIQVGNLRMTYWCLALTAALGTAFLVLKGVEYYSDYVDNLMPRIAFKPEADEWRSLGIDGAKHVELALTFYYFMTLLHALHLTIGIALLLFLIIAVSRRTVTPQRYMPVEIIGLYWHFVDVVWIFLLPLLYLIGTHKTFW
ncbi:MAG TPA: cytochrome c oxidase subunit 3 [Pirellulales bacterium]|jgi:cytochrome c oxidase subunit 3|nr:cytochrome c oxidase subunit 3 [Pirellulales bacterium]